MYIYAFTRVQTLIKHRFLGAESWRSQRPVTPRWPILAKILFWDKSNHTPADSEKLFLPSLQLLKFTLERRTYIRKREAIKGDSSLLKLFCIIGYLCFPIISSLLLMLSFLCIPRPLPVSLTQDVIYTSSHCLTVWNFTSVWIPHMYKTKFDFLLLICPTWIWFLVQLRRPLKGSWILSPNIIFVNLIREKCLNFKLNSQIMTFLDYFISFSFNCLFTSFANVPI